MQDTVAATFHSFQDSKRSWRTRTFSRGDPSVVFHFRNLQSHYLTRIPRRAAERLGRRLRNHMIFTSRDSY